MVALFQVLVWSKLFENQYTWQVFGITTCTVLLCLLGYIINDYYDLSVDKKFKPGANLFEKYSIPHIHFWYGAITLLITFTGYLLQSWSLALLFFVIAVLLWGYSALLKRIALVGNVLVALSTALVPAALLLTQQSGSNTIVTGWHTLEHFPKAEIMTYGYMLFAFLLSLARELVKDAEDQDGDKEAGMKTAPIIWPIVVVKTLSIILLVSTLLLLAYFSWWQFHHPQVFSDDGVLQYYIWFLLIPTTIRSIYMVYEAEEMTEWRKLSKWLKIIMLLGVVSILLL